MTVNKNTSSQAHAVVKACIVSPIVSSLFVLLRVWTRLFVRRAFGWDDYAAIITLLLCVTYSVILGISVNASGISPDIYYAYDKRIFVSTMVYVTTLLGYKITILLLCLRLFGVNRNFRRCTWALMFFVFGYLFSNLLTEIFGCMPISKAYQPETPGHCIDSIRVGLVYGAMNIASDLFIFVLPLPMVWRLQLTVYEKLGVSFIFMNGAINCTSTTLRYNFVAHKSHSIFSEPLGVKIFVWQVVEVNTGLICSCTPAIKPFIQHLASKNYSQHTWRSLGLKSSIFTRRSASDRRNNSDIPVELSRN